MGKIKNSILCSLLIVILILSGCSFPTSGAKENEWVHAPCSKDGVSEFMTILGDVRGEGLHSGGGLSEDNCFNVTPKEVAKKTNVKIFKFSDSCLSLALIDGEIYEICTSFGGYGFVNALPWDYDEDGTMDLLIASSCGSGLHRSEISVFNGKTKQSTRIITGADVDEAHPQRNFIVTATSSSSFAVYSAGVRSGDHLADLSYNLVSCVGFVSVENGVPEFRAYSE